MTIRTLRAGFRGLAVGLATACAVSAIVAIVTAAAVTAVWSGRSAMSHEAVRAVREDW